jgi:hypothetical protein
MALANPKDWGQYAQMNRSEKMLKSKLNNLETAVKAAVDLFFRLWR